MGCCLRHQALSLSMLQCPFCGHTAAAEVAEVAEVANA